MPGGFVGHRRNNEPRKWNLELKDARDGSRIDLLLSFIDHGDGMGNGATPNSAPTESSGAARLRGGPKYKEQIDSQVIKQSAAIRRNGAFASPFIIGPALLEACGRFLTQTPDARRVVYDIVSRSAIRAAHELARQSAGSPHYFHYPRMALRSQPHRAALFPRVVLQPAPRCFEHIAVGDVNVLTRGRDHLFLIAPLNYILKTFNLSSMASKSKPCSYPWRRERQRFHSVFTIGCLRRRYQLGKYPQRTPKDTGNFSQRNFTSTARPSAPTCVYTENSVLGKKSPFSDDASPISSSN
jgi:hypothetical protein